MRYLATVLLFIIATTTVSASATDEPCTLTRHWGRIESRPAALTDGTQGVQTRTVSLTVEVCDNGVKRVRTAIRGPWGVVHP